MTILQSLQDEDVECRAPWMTPDKILSRQFIPAMQGFAQCEFAYKGDNYKKKKLEAEKIKKGKNKAEKDLDSLKIDYKKVHLSLKTSGLGKISE
ncbi:hypothetical protein Gotri_010990 [Gossypium trilobum]|uniref:Uncharacterized protein n=1 Tax=Gossypium trilobum TaxID=34281 RepID=A0A7J9ETV7_9ROSI|nr:hypothetical protein [Gossypium trilobum]